MRCPQSCAISLGVTLRNMQCYPTFPDLALPTQHPDTYYLCTHTYPSAVHRDSVQHAVAYATE